MVGGLCAAIAVTANAQENQDTSDIQSASELEEIFVTASRIRRDGMSTPTPTTMVSSDVLDAMAPGSLIEGISQMPQFFGNETLNATTGGGNFFTRGSYGSLNLRGLGINRTLTLLNGRRMISSTAFGGVDVNQFPEAMIKSVESITGGASAAYGTDAVAGVANFILDTDFEGWEIAGQYGETDIGDGENDEFSVAFGTKIGERGHLQLSYERATQEAIQGLRDRDWYKGWGTVRTAEGLQVVPNVVSASSSYNGLIWAPGSSLNGMQFNNTGTAIEPFLRGDISTATPAGIPPSNQSGGSGDDYSLYNQALMPDMERDSLFIYGDYQVTDSFNLFGQVIRSTNEVTEFARPGGSFQGTPTSLTIFQDNAFLPDSVRQSMIDTGLESFTLRTMGTPEGLAGESYVVSDVEMDSYTFGFEWELNDWNVNAYYQKGESERLGKQHSLRVDRIFAALDAVDDGSGNIVCRSQLIDPSAFEGCEPINLFGRGNVSAAALDYVMGFEAGESVTTDIYFADTGFDSGRTYSYTTSAEKVNVTTLDQQIFEIAASGQVSEGWGAGPIDLAFGYSYREEEILQLVQDVTNPASNHSPRGFQAVLCDDESIGLRGVSVPDCLNTVGVQYSKVSNIQGSSEVDELFVETLVPLVSGAAAADSLNLSLAARWADYSGAGEAWAWKGGLDWQVNSQLRLRGTMSRDVRAANLSERFDVTGGTATIVDPVLDDAYTVTIFSGGNPNLDVEEADTLTFGVVYEPGFIEGLSMSLDWYEVEVNDSIGNLTPQGVVNACEAGDTEACARISRDPNTDEILLVGDQFVNIDKEVVSGVDFEISYKTETDWFGADNESLTARFFVAHLSERSRQNAGADKIDRAGQTGYEGSTGNPYAFPDYKLTGQLTYQYNNFSTFLQGRYISSGVSENNAPDAFVLSDNSVDSAFYTDLNLRYLHNINSNAEIEFFANVTNLFDVDPPVTPNYNIFISRARQDNPALFDALGRRFTAGVKVRF